MGLAGMLGSRLLTLLLHVAIARFFGITFFGYFITGIMLCQILQVIASMGLPIGSTRFMVKAIADENRQDMFRIYWACIFEPLIAGSIIGLLFYLAAPFLCNAIFSKPDLLPVLKLFAFVVPWLALLRILAGLSRSFGTVRYTVVFENILFPLIQILVLLFAFFTRANPELVVLGFFSASIACALMMGFVVHRQIAGLTFTREGAADPGSRVSVGELFKYSVPLMPTGVYVMIYNNIDIFMLNIFSSGVGVGIYAAATRWTILLDSIGIPIWAIFRPLIAKAISAEDPQTLRSIYMASVRWVLYLVLPFMACLFVASQPAMKFFLKEDTIGIAAVLLWILLFARITNPLGNGAGLLLTMGGQQYKELLSLVCGGILNIALNAFLIPRFGVIGAAIATGAGLYISTILRISFVWNKWRMIPWTTRMIVPLFALGIVIILRLLGGASVPAAWQVAGGGVAALFVVSSILFYGLDHEDKSISSLLPGSVQKIIWRVQHIANSHTFKNKIS